MTKLQIQTTNDPIGVALQFIRGDDRWTHRWLIGADADRVCVMTSVEGTPADVWPASPPLQDASCHDQGAGEAILCVGMAGKSHWSAAYSVEQANSAEQADPSGDIVPAQAGACLVKSDLACLQKETAPTAWLGSSYVLAEATQVSSADSDRVTLLTETGLTMELNAISAEDFETRLELSGKLLTIKPVRISQNPKLATRWAFRIQIDRR